MRSRYRMLGCPASNIGRLAGLALLCAALHACVTTPPEVMETTLTKGFIYSDGKQVYDIADIRTDKPVALFLHGCAGFSGTRQFNIMNMIDERRFEIVAPDSFQRQRNRVTCRGQTLHLRDEDIAYALNRIRQVTSQPVVLVGFSEGGRAAALYNGAVKVAGKAILAYDCHHGLAANAPLLNIQGRFDQEIRRGNDLCPTSNSHYVETGHDVSGPQAQKLLRDFMSEAVRRQ